MLQYINIYVHCAYMQTYGIIVFRLPYIPLLYYMYSVYTYIRANVSKEIKIHTSLRCVYYAFRSQFTSRTVKYDFGV